MVVEPVGRWYEGYCLRRQHKHTLSHHSQGLSSSSESSDQFSADEDDESILLTLDPKEWKVGFTPHIVLAYLLQSF